MSKTEEPTTAAMVGHYIQCMHTLACARRDLGQITEQSPRPEPKTLEAMEESIINTAKLISALVLREMSVMRVGAGVPS